MAIDAKEKRIGSHTYRVTKLGALQGRAMLVRLVRLAGPGVGSFLGGAGRSHSTPGEPKLEPALALGLAEAIHDFCSRLREDELGALMDELAKYTVVVVSPEIQPRLSDIFDDHFAGAYDVMLQWLRFALEVNFASFFVGSSGDSPLARFWKVLSQSASQVTSTGISTASPPASATPQA